MSDLMKLSAEIIQLITQYSDSEKNIYFFTLMWSLQQYLILIATGSSLLRPKGASVKSKTTRSCLQSQDSPPW
ncbi:hypothetical protein I7I50_02646 [Histoplasma capsulatum G186AR]|uniref:Uncharacterized protein n=1 Tax=Ajellomyces capsulatus TaxID=5037 RepID=A0A8H8D7U5_AJECA|nr:hypothetical protein I7I52_00688 [Histoplasma capsulatum]QSS71702.1 hypothetical protein I7I50_02646 [Histoplasma capsulatum G186AR]